MYHAARTASDTISTRELSAKNTTKKRRMMSKRGIPIIAGSSVGLLRELFLAFIPRGILLNLSFSRVRAKAVVPPR
jgi:hypothetical protein